MKYQFGLEKVRVLALAQLDDSGDPIDMLRRVLQNPVHALYGWACQRLYYELAAYYDPISALASLGRWHAWRSLALDYIAGDSVLELGCGTGRLLAALAQHAKRVVALERSLAMAIQATSTPGASSGETVTLVQGDAECIPLATHSVDTIVSTFPAPYILQQRTLAECLRVLRAPQFVSRHNSDEGCVTPGRLVIVGLWVRPAGNRWAARLMRLLPVLYGAPDLDGLERIRAALEAQGFSVRLTERYARDAYIGVALAERI